MATFGHTSKGAAGSQSIGRRLTGSVFRVPEDGVAESVSAYINAWSGSQRSYRWAVYRHSDGALIGLTEERTTTSDPEGWVTLNFPDPKPQLSANTEYVLCGLCSSAPGTSPLIFYDNDEATKGHYQSLTTYAFPNPANFSHEARKYSIYCTYTPLTPTIKQWSQTGRTLHVFSRPSRILKLIQNLQVFHVFRRHRFVRFTQALRMLRAWTVIFPSLTLKQWTAMLQTIHVFRRPFRRLGYLRQLQPAHVFRRPARTIKLPASLQLIHYARTLRFIRFLEQLGLIHMVYVAVPGVKKTKVFLVIGELAIQLSKD